jgi:hypothetical protein
MNLRPTLRPIAPAVLAVALLAACAPSPEAGEPPAATTAAAAAADIASTPAGPVAIAVDAIRTRMQQRLPRERLAEAAADDILPLLTPDELEVLSTDFLQFHVDAPASIYVMQSPDSEIEPFLAPVPGVPAHGPPRPRWGR